MHRCVDSVCQAQHNADATIDALIALRGIDARIESAEPGRPLVIFNADLHGVQANSSLIFSCVLCPKQRDQQPRANQPGASSNINDTNAFGDSSTTTTSTSTSSPSIDTCNGEFPLLLARSSSAGGAVKASEVSEGALMWLQRTFDCRVAPLQLPPHMLTVLLATWPLRRMTMTTAMIGCADDLHTTST
jgi:hypothetical protein